MEIIMAGDTSNTASCSNAGLDRNRVCPCIQTLMCFRIFVTKLSNEIA